MSRFDYRRIVGEMEHNLERFGDSFEGVGWTRKREFAELRYRVMLEGLRAEWPRPLRLLDFGCGAGHLYEHLVRTGVQGIDYTGLDLSADYVGLCREKHPAVEFLQADILEEGDRVPRFDFVVLNGLFHYKGEGASGERMWDYAQEVLSALWAHADRGIAFNAMSDLVDWQRDDLFHLPVATACDFVARKLGRDFAVRHDYGLYEYTVYAYKEPLSATV